MCGSIYDLSFEYMVSFPVSNDTSTKKQVLIDIANLLSTGWTYDDMYKHIREFKKSSPNEIMDLKSYFSTKNKTKVNILKPLKFYYHNELRILPPPPLIEVDYNKGEFTRTLSEYFLEMKASYTVEDLYEYFLHKEHLYDKGTLNANRIIGSLSWLIKKFPIDQILFMIDVANDIICTTDKKCLTTPMDIQDYFKEAHDAINRKATESKATGDDKVIPKKRVLPLRKE